MPSGSLGITWFHFHLNENERGVSEPLITVPGREAMIAAGHY